VAGYALPEASRSDHATQRVVLKLPVGSRAEVVFVKLRSKKAGRRTGIGPRTAR